MEGKGLLRKSFSIFDVKSEMEFEGFYKLKQSNYINHLLVDFVPSLKVAIVSSNLGFKWTSFSVENKHLDVINMVMIRYLR